MDSYTMSTERIASPTNRVQSIDESGFPRRIRQFERFPTHLIRIWPMVYPVAAQQRSGLVRLELVVHNGWPDLVEPRTLILAPGHCERCARQLFCVQPIGTFLRIVLGGGQCVRIIGMLRWEVIAETIQILREMQPKFYFSARNSVTFPQTL